MAAVVGTCRLEDNLVPLPCSPPHPFLSVPPSHAPPPHQTMKKDMGGAALMLALAHVIMSSRLPVRLRVLVPAVENSVSGDAYRPLDVLQTRAGITIEQVGRVVCTGVGV